MTVIRHFHFHHHITTPLRWIPSSRHEYLLILLKCGMHVIRHLTEQLCHTRLIIYISDGFKVEMITQQTALTGTYCVMSYSFNLFNNKFITSVVRYLKVKYGETSQESKVQQQQNKSCSTGNYLISHYLRSFVS